MEQRACQLRLSLGPRSGLCIVMSDIHCRVRASGSYVRRHQDCLLRWEVLWVLLILRDRASIFLGLRP